MVPTPRRVSVLVSTYNRPEYLRLALRSILAQSYDDFDVLVWNDGGSEMEGIVPELDDPRVRYHHHPENLGVMQAVAEGVRATHGEYIAHMDDDDEWDPGFLAAQVRLLDENPTASIAFCDHWIIDEDGTIDARSTEHNSRHWGRLELRAGLHEPAYEITLSGTIPMASAAVIRRSDLDIDDVPAAMYFAWDLWVAYLATHNGRGVVFNPGRLSRKRRHAQQMGSAVASIRNLTDLVLAYERMWGEPSFDVDRDALAGRLSAASANWSIALLREGDYDGAAAAARRSIEVRRSARGYAAVAVSSLPPQLSRLVALASSNALARWRRVSQASHVGHGAH